MDFPLSLRADGMGTDANTLVLRGDTTDKEWEWSFNTWLSLVSAFHPINTFKSHLVSPYFLCPYKLTNMQLYKKITRLVYKDHEEKLCVSVETRLNNL